MNARALDDIPAGLGEAGRDQYMYDMSVNRKGSSEDDHSVSAHDGIHDGLVFPTEEERGTLRRVSDTVPWNAYCE